MVLWLPRVARGNVYETISQQLAFLRNLAWQLH